MVDSLGQGRRGRAFLLLGLCCTPVVLQESRGVLLGERGPWLSLRHSENVLHKLWSYYLLLVSSKSNESYLACCCLKAMNE